MSRFAIVSMGRTGSTMLVGLLDSHPGIECKGELFGPHGAFHQHTGTSRREYLERYAYDTDQAIKGFKMPFDWILDYPGIFDDFSALGYKIVRLNRRRPLDHFLSINLAQANMNFESQEKYKVQKITIDPWQVVTFLGSRNTQMTVLDRFCANANAETEFVDYEDLTSEACHRRLLGFLGASPQPLTAMTVRQRRGGLRDSIGNYDELVAFLRCSPFAGLLPPEDRA